MIASPCRCGGLGTDVVGARHRSEPAIHAFISWSLSGRDKLHKELASGTQTIERVHAHAQAQVSDRLVEDQSGVIANLWRILGWAGISPQQVQPLRMCCKQPLN